MGTLVDLERCARLHMGAAKLGCRKTRHHDSFHTRTLLSSLLPNPRPHPGLKLIRILSGGKVEREGDALKSALHLMSGESFWHVTLRTSLWRQTGWQDGGPVCTCQSQHPSSTTEVLTNVTNSHLRLIIYGGKSQPVKEFAFLFCHFNTCFLKFCSFNWPHSLRSVLVYSLETVQLVLLWLNLDKTFSVWKKQLIPWDSSQEFKYIDLCIYQLSNNKWTFVWSIL